ncbi:M67 family metallopeptidase [Paraherbaspirillum soli]|uniref:M67 family metallopeptidase n=1 Tax=Paraherbaspirillum soli TaxID=631222 RepID=A0ABW0ME50_9BURK
MIKTAECRDSRFPIPSHMVTLQLSEFLRASLERWAHAGYPVETCGLLLGERNSACSTIKRVTQAKNLSHERTRDRYLLDPQDFLAADNAARANGMEVLGIWHTHPDHPARPSEIDQAAAWPEWSYLILAVTRDGVKDIRSWRLNGDMKFDEEVIQS